MRDIRIGAAQFENRNGDKASNLAAMKKLVLQAVERGAEMVSFHEVCIPAYTFVRNLPRDRVVELAEPIPDGPTMAVKEPTGNLTETFSRIKDSS